MLPDVRVSGEEKYCDREKPTAGPLSRHAPVASRDGQRTRVGFAQKFKFEFKSPRRSPADQKTGDARRERERGRGGGETEVKKDLTSFEEEREEKRKKERRGEENFRKMSRTDSIPPLSNYLFLRQLKISFPSCTLLPFVFFLPSLLHFTIIARDIIGWSRNFSFSTAQSCDSSGLQMNGSTLVRETRISIMSDV